MVSVRREQERHTVVEDIHFEEGDRAAVAGEDTVLSDLVEVRRMVVGVVDMSHVGEGRVDRVVAAADMGIVAKEHHMVGFEDMG